MITEKKFSESASRLGCDLAAIKAVAEVESGGNGFLSTGEPTILFEPHLFWQQLIKVGINPKLYVKGNEDILYPVWKSGHYGKVSEQHNRLERASKINREAALKSASWGKFQILGKNHRLAGYEQLQDFINAMYKSEDEHLTAFVGFVQNNFLADELREHDWKGFAYGYNGAAYRKNKYDEKLAAAYKKYST